MCRITNDFAYPIDITQIVLYKCIIKKYWKNIWNWKGVNEWDVLGFRVWHLLRFDQFDIQMQCYYLPLKLNCDNWKQMMMVKKVRGDFGREITYFTKPELKITFIRFSIFVYWFSTLFYSQSSIIQIGSKGRVNSNRWDK